MVSRLLSWIMLFAGLICLFYEYSTAGIAPHGSGLIACAAAYRAFFVEPDDMVSDQV